MYHNHFISFLEALKRDNNIPLIEAIQKGYEILFEAVGRNIMYHGTHKRNLRSILKQGLIPNPKQREWKEDIDTSEGQISRQSYEGIYLTENLMTATGSAGRRTDRSGKTREKEKLVIVVDIEKATAVPDEDDLTGMFGIKQGLGNFFGKKWLGENMALQAYINMMQDKGNLTLSKNAINSLQVWEQGFSDKTPQHKEYLKAKIPYVVDVMKKYITRQAAWKIENSDLYKEEEFQRLEEANVPKPPDVKQAETDFRNSMDTLMKKMKASFTKGFMGNTARMLTPITYRGSNKIIAVLGMVDNYNNKDYVYGETPGHTIKEYYGSVADPRFADDFTKEMERFGKWDVADKQ